MKFQLLLALLLFACGDDRVIPDTDTFYQLTENLGSSSITTGTHCECSFTTQSCCEEDRLVFVTKLSEAATLSDFDKQCENSASQNPDLIGKKWKTWYSTSILNAVDRIDQINGTFSLLNGNVIAYGWKDLLDGALFFNIDVDQNTTENTNLLIATGTNFDGVWVPNFDCGDWINLTSQVILGSTLESDVKWTISESNTCSEAKGIYCFETQEDTF